MTDRMLAEMTNTGKTVHPPIYTCFVSPFYKQRSVLMWAEEDSIENFVGKEAFAHKIHTSPKVGFKPCYR